MNYHMPEVWIGLWCPLVPGTPSGVSPIQSQINLPSILDPQKAKPENFKHNELESSGWKYGRQDDRLAGSQSVFNTPATPMMPLTL